MEVASQVVVLNQGRIEQQGAPDQIYEHPNNAFVSKFIGQTNILHLQETHSDWLKTAGIDCDNVNGVVAHIRPHNIAVEKADANATSPLTLKDWLHLGAIIRIEIYNPLINQENGGIIYAEMPTEHFRALHLEKGDRVVVHIKHAHWFN